MSGRPVAAEVLSPSSTYAGLMEMRKNADMGRFIEKRENVYSVSVGANAADDAIITYFQSIFSSS